MHSVRIILRGDRPEDQGIFSNVIPESIKRLRELPQNLDTIKNNIEREFGRDKDEENEKKKEWSKALGWFCGYVAEIGAALHIPFFTNKFGFNYKVYKWNKISMTASAIIDILDIQAAGCGNGEIDVLFADEKTVHCFSSKLKHIYSGKIRWGEVEIKQMRIVENKNVKQFTDHSAVYGAFVYDKNDFINECRQYKDVIVYDWTDLKEIWNQVYKCLERYNFDYKKINEIICDGKTDFIPYFHQEEASTAAFEWLIGRDEKSFLFDHICRSGKTLTALYTALKMNAKNVLLLTSFPCINEMEWHSSIRKFRDFNRFNVIDVSSSSRNLKKFRNNDYNFVMISMQDLKSRDGEGRTGNYGIDKEKFDEIREVDWDLIIYDEVHEGYETDKSNEVISHLKYDKLLALSATPFVNYALGTFTRENSHHWGLVDEAKWSKKYPYYNNYPKMNFLLYSPDGLYKDIMAEYSANEGLTYKKLFRVENDKFFYENDIVRELKYVFGIKDQTIKLPIRESPFGYRRDQGETIGKGIIIFVPEVKHAKLLCDLIKNMPQITGLYGESIDCTYSDKYRGNNRSEQLQQWINKITSNDRFIIIAEIGRA